MVNKQQKVDTNEQEEITASQAAKILARGREARVNAVAIGIQELLKEYNCTLDTQMIFSGNKGVVGGKLVIEPLADQSIA